MIVTYSLSFSKSVKPLEPSFHLVVTFCAAMTCCECERVTLYHCHHFKDSLVLSSIPHTKDKTNLDYFASTNCHSSVQQRPNADYERMYFCCEALARQHAILDTQRFLQSSFDPVFLEIRFASLCSMDVCPFQSIIKSLLKFGEWTKYCNCFYNF